MNKGSTLFSREWSTSELADGMAHLLTDMRAELPDDLEHLKVLERSLADLEAAQKTAEAREDLDLMELKKMEIELEVKTAATPQYHHAREQAAAESQQTQTQPEVSPTLPDSDGESLRKMKSASMEPTPEEERDPDLSAVMLLFQSGKLDAEAAMKLLSGAKGATTAAKPPTLPQPKRPRENEAASDGDKRARVGSGTPVEPSAPESNAETLADELAERQKKRNKNKVGDAQDEVPPPVDPRRRMFTRLDKEDMVKILHWNAKKVEGAIKSCRNNPGALVRRNKYSGEEEFNVEVRENASREQEETNEEQRIRTAEDTGDLSAPDMSGIARLNDADMAREAPEHQATSEALQAKEVFRRFSDSILSKCAKIRSLMSDLKKNYAGDNLAQKSVGALEADLQLLDGEYNKCSDMMARGEQNDFDQAWRAAGDKLMKESTFVCTKVAQNEAKIRNAKRHFTKVVKEETAA
ncbi:unnamed protein product [Durusdinium trenchii]|uniref:Uncharacterized protein n=1 Tax=Durusdinium trenchii TaxID=1381693 RepID=A0ABP0RQ80_9DINO